MFAIRLATFSVISMTLFNLISPRTAMSIEIDFSQHGGDVLLPYSEDELTFAMSPAFADGRIDTVGHNLVLAPLPTGVGYTVTASHDAGAPFNLYSFVYSATPFSGPDSFTITSDRGGNINIPIVAPAVDVTFDFSVHPLFQGIRSFSIDHGPSALAPSFEVIFDRILFAVVPEPHSLGLVPWGVAYISLQRCGFRWRSVSKRLRASAHMMLEY